MAQIEKIKQKRKGKFVSLCWFRAYDRELTEFFLHDEKPNIGQVELLLLDICTTIQIHEIQIVKLPE